MAVTYEKLELLGSGSFGKAWLVCSWKHKQCRQAVLKEVRLDSMLEKELDQAMVEVKVMARCRHVNIVSYCEAFLDSGCLNIVMEYADGGDLQKKMQEQRGIYFSKETILDWFVQICFALKYLHSQNILHRDLKPQNLFVTLDGIIKVGDFGIARILQDRADHAVTAIGTPYYLSPEICQRQPYNHKSDMWSLGCVLYELCCLKVPFQGPNLPALVLRILEGTFHPIPREQGAVLEDLVSVLLKTDPSLRPSAQQLLSVPALQPQVKVTHRRCLEHKHRRQSQRAKSVDSLTPGGGDKTDSPITQHKTFTVQQSVLRKLPEASPKLKAAVKRRRAVQSAEPRAARRKIHKSSSPPVCNLQDVFLKIPSSGSKPVCQSPNTVDPHFHHMKREGRSGFKPKVLRTDSIDSDVFEEDVLPSNLPPDMSRLFVNNPQKEQRHAENVRYKRDPIDRNENAYSVKVSPAKRQPGERKDSLFQQNQIPGIKNVRPTKFRTYSLGAEEDKYAAPKCCALKRLAGCVVRPKDWTEAEKRDCAECVCGKSSSFEHCLQEALYCATALAHSQPLRAQRHLSHFLLTHLGSEVSLHLCSLVSSALRRGQDYVSLERIVKSSLTCYLPAVLQLLAFNDPTDSE